MIRRYILNKAVAKHEQAAKELKDTFTRWGYFEGETLLVGGNPFLNEVRAEIRCAQRIKKMIWLNK